MQEIILKSTGAIGDTVLASALQRKLNEKGYKTGIISTEFTLSIWEGLENTSVYTFEDEIPEGSRLVDISNYLRHHVCSQQLDGKFVHLSEWMAYEFALQTGMNLEVSREDIRVILTKDEIREGVEAIKNISREYRSKPVILISPYSSNKNRNLPLETLEKVVAGVKGFAVPCIRSVEARQERIEGLYYLDVNKRVPNSRAVSPELSLSADAILTVDTGPLHVAMGSIYGISEGDLMEGIKPKPGKIVVILGSSRIEAVTYEGNKFIAKGHEVCKVAPCGASSYHPIESYSRKFNTKFYEIEDGSGCIFEDYRISESSRCMQAISAEEIIENLREAVK